LCIQNSSLYYCSDHLGFFGADKDLCIQQSWTMKSFSENPATIQGFLLSEDIQVRVWRPNRLNNIIQKEHQRSPGKTKMTPNTPVGKMIGALAEYVMITALSKIFWWMHIPDRYSLSNCDVCLRYRLTVLLPCNGCRWCINCINEQFDTVNHDRSLWPAR
jgi:hypothetical protein